MDALLENLHLGAGAASTVLLVVVLYLLFDLRRSIREIGIRTDNALERIARLEGKTE